MSRKRGRSRTRGPYTIVVCVLFMLSRLEAFHAFATSFNRQHTRPKRRPMAVRGPLKDLLLRPLLPIEPQTRELTWKDHWKPSFIAKDLRPNGGRTIGRAVGCSAVDRRARSIARPTSLPCSPSPPIHVPS
eukprot:scaffold1182_cov165-Amphora_coffeaeformis.AAC.11